MVDDTIRENRPDATAVRYCLAPVICFGEHLDNGRRLRGVQTEIDKT